MLKQIRRLYAIIMYHLYQYINIISGLKVNIFFFGKEGNILKLRWKNPLHYKHEPG